MELIEVLKPGILTTIQDQGRVEAQKYGVSTSGAMDRLSMRLANILVGNDENDAVLEVTLVGPTLKFKEEALVTVTGANLSPTINGEPIDLWRTIRVSTDDVLSFGRSKDGSCRSYIAIAGGIDVPQIMGSRSTFIRGGYGGIEGRNLRAGDVISVIDKNNRLGITGRILPSEYIPSFHLDRPIRFIYGPQVDAYSKGTIETFISNPYRIMNESDRMGYRLEGAPLKHINSADMISDFITMGSIQVPGNGQPIVLMADCQVTGGYFKIGVVISVDLPYLAQKKPGDSIRFQPIEIEEAQQLWIKQEEWLQILKTNNN